MTDEQPEADPDDAVAELAQAAPTRNRYRGEPADLPAPTTSARVLASMTDVVFAGVLVPVLDLAILALLLHPSGTHVFTPSEQRTAFLLYLVILMLGAAVFVAMERTGASFGKRLFGLRTVSLEGISPAPLPQLAMKYLLIFVLLLFNFYGALLVLLGMFVPFWQAERRNAFDLVTRLRVVPASALKKIAADPPVPGTAGSTEPAQD